MIATSNATRQTHRLVCRHFAGRRGELVRVDCDAVFGIRVGQVRVHVLHPAARRAQADFLNFFPQDGLLHSQSDQHTPKRIKCHCSKQPDTSMLSIDSAVNTKERTASSGFGSSLEARGTAGGGVDGGAEAPLAPSWLLLGSH